MIKMRKPNIDRICLTCLKPKKGKEFQYNYSKGCMPCFNEKATAERHASNVPDLAFQQRGESLFFGIRAL